MRITALFAAMLTMLGGCSGDPTGDSSPTPGTLKVSLASPNSGDEALLVRITGEEISNVTVSGAGRTAFVRAVTPTRIVVVIVGPVGSGELLRFDVPDTRQRTSYVATVLEASDATNTLRASTTGYALTVLR